VNAPAQRSHGATTPLRPRPGSGRLAGPLVHRDVTGSTNDDARSLALAGAPAGTVVVAEEQTAGRGRQGRQWAAPRGRTLILSVVLRPATSAATGWPGLALLPLAVAVGVSEACEAAAPVRCRIKWPNDVLVDGRKVAGILIESRPQEGWAVSGIGLNVDTTDEELGALRDSATSLSIAAREAVDRNLVLELLLDRLAAWTSPSTDASAILAAYRERDALAGEPITWIEGAGTRSGRAAGIDEHGRLVVFAEAGERIALDAGEVHLKKT
jgi:BirA family transcriptional regulator, biotin operon repressor / biotin---[acetyl-CoA-carboxylase] ligase